MDKLETLNFRDKLNKHRDRDFKHRERRDREKFVFPSTSSSNTSLSFFTKLHFISKTLVPEGHNVLAHSRSDYSDTGTNLDSTPNYYGDPNPYEVYSEIQYARATNYKEFEPIGGSAAGVKQSCGVPKLLVCPLLNEHAKNVWRAIR
ncbi:hypothetical protein LguiB_014090 [Lonicera macranthoides]